MERRDDDEVTREDFEHAVRFVADGAMRAAHRAARVEALLRSVVRALVEAGLLELDAFERNLMQPPRRPADPAAPAAPADPAAAPSDASREAVLSPGRGR